MSMKWIVALLVSAVLAAGIGIALVTLVLPARQQAPGPKERRAVRLLQVEENKDPFTTESGVEGHRDLPFQNPADRPVKVRLERTDCQCAHVLICLAPDAWQSLEEEGQLCTVPPRAAGLLRLKWKTTMQGAHRFWADLAVDDGEDHGYQRVELAVHLLEPVRIRTEEDPERSEPDVGRLRAGAERTTKLLCYSDTRDHFTLAAAPSGDDPCIVYGPLQPLTREELQTVGGKPGTPARAGYRVSVTVREQAGNARLDIGPFRRPVAWQTDVFPGHKVSTHVSGEVQGEVWLAAPADQTSVDMGTVSPTSPSPVFFTLESRDPQLRLSVDEEKTLGFLEVELLESKEGGAAGAGRTWRGRILFRTDSLFRGPFPNKDRRGYDSAVLCSLVFLISREGQTVEPGGPSARRLLVPVKGIVPSF